MRQNIILAGLIVGVVCLILGFGGGAVLTRPDRDKTSIIIAESQKTHNQEIETLTIQIEKLNKKSTQKQEAINNLKKDLIDLKKQNEVLAAELKQKEQPIIKEITNKNKSETISPIAKTKPIFGIPLGEDINILKQSIWVVKSDIVFEDKDNPSVVWQADLQNENFSNVYLYVYNNLIYKTRFCFKDTTTTNFESIKKLLIDKYGQDAAGLTGVMFGEAEFQTLIGEVKIQIQLNRDDNFGSDDLLELSYTHIDLLLKLYSEIKTKKASKVQDQL